MSVLQPIGQVRLTNVAYVRLTRKGKRFEIACYRNKVLNWRNKIEQDINEVLQVASVFTNVSKGTHASGKDLLEAFGTSDHTKVCEEILERGDLQVSEQEREAMLESTFRDVASLVCEMTINPENGRQYSLSMIQNAMQQIHFSVKLSKSPKQQALDVIRKLRPVMSIVRAGMLLRIVVRGQDGSAIEDMLKLENRLVTIVNRQAVETAARGNTADSAGNISFEVLVDPEVYRRLEDSVKTISEGVGRVEILQLRAGSAGGYDVSTPESPVEEKSVKGSILNPAEDSKQSVRLKDRLASADAEEEEFRETANTNRQVSRLKKKEKKEKKRKDKALLLAHEQQPENDVKEEDVMPNTPPLTTPVIPPDPPTDDASTGKKCNTCGGSFTGDVEYRQHFRSEWHRYNLKRKMKSLPVVAEAEFSSLPRSEVEKSVDSV